MNTMAAGCRLHPVEAAALRSEDSWQLGIAAKASSLPGSWTEQRSQLPSKLHSQRHAARALSSSSASSLAAGASNQEFEGMCTACSKQPGPRRGSRIGTRAASGNGHSGASAAAGAASDSDNPVNADVSSASYGGMLRGDKEERDFVRWFREAWPYIQGHRGSTFVIVIPGEVVANTTLFDNILQDIALMHGLGVKIVIVPGSQVQIDEQLREKGLEPVFCGAYRVTDAEALEAAMEASGRTRVDIEAKLSRGPVIPVLRRHGESEKWHEVGISVASGNFVFAKRRGVLQGVDFGATGEVKKVDVERIRSRLDSGCVVLLSNLGFCPSGEVLNCNTYEVATLCATAIHADKLICLIDGPVVDATGRLVRWMTLQQADLLIRDRAQVSYTAGDYVKAVAGAEYAKSIGLPNGTPAVVNGAGAAGGAGAGAGAGAKKGGAPGVAQSMELWVEEVGRQVALEQGEAQEAENEENEAEASLARWNAQRALYTMDFQKPKPLFSSAANGGPKAGNASASGNGTGNGSGNGSGNGVRGLAVGGEERTSGAYGYLSELTAAVFACRGGVRRVHLLDSSLEGALLLELYTRDGIGTMVSSDLYEGTRAAQVTDVRGIQALLQPLEEAGVLVARSEDRLMRELPYFTVVERDGCIIACAALFPFAAEQTAEVAAFAVSPVARGHGRGDNLLAYLEQRAQDMGMCSLFLLTTRTADWFIQRGFAPCDLEKLPKERYEKIDKSRGSKSFRKILSVSSSLEAATAPSKGALPTDLPKYGRVQ